MLTLHQMQISGNCYKVRLAAHQLGIPIAVKEYGLHDGTTRTPEYLAKNPNGRVPMLELEDGRVLPESGAILWYLAEGTALVPDDKWHRAQALQWMFFEQYSHEPYVAVARFIRGWLPADHPRQAELPRLLERGHAALEVMDRHLAAREFFVDAGYGIADIALHAYTHSAAAGGFELSRYPSLQSWLERVRATPGFVPQST